MSFNLNQDKCYIMGILNVTTDSFFDGGKYLTLDKIMFRVDKMIAEGTDIIDAEIFKAWLSKNFCSGGIR